MEELRLSSFPSLLSKLSTSNKIPLHAGKNIPTSWSLLKINLLRFKNPTIFSLSQLPKPKQAHISTPAASYLQYKLCQMLKMIHFDESMYGNIRNGISLTILMLDPAFGNHFFQHRSPFETHHLPTGLLVINKLIM